jgi:GH15 family glucan-1,4-alpha-glucosidase
MADEVKDAEIKRLEACGNPVDTRLTAKVAWKKWGPYLSERQWGTVREDYSDNGDAWNYFSHDQARSRAYDWGEDGLGGICDDHQILCFALALWNALDRAIKFAEGTGRAVPLDRWRRVRDEIHADVCAHGFDTERNTFVQYYGATGLDASLLLIPISGFLPPQDRRVLGTIDAIQREICSGPYVWRYSTEEGVDGLAGSEGTFLICSFWLVSALALAGRVEEAKRNLEQLRALQDDVGLFSEEYDPVGRRLLGNFPQAFSHIRLLHSIFTISEAKAGG